jgi:hypothetical protein
VAYDWTRPSLDQSFEIVPTLYEVCVCGSRVCETPPTRGVYESSVYPTPVVQYLVPNVCLGAGIYH